MPIDHNANINTDRTDINDNDNRSDKTNEESWRKFERQTAGHHQDK